LNLGTYLRKTGRPVEAAREMDEALRLDPGYAIAHLAKAELLAATDPTGAADEALAAAADDADRRLARPIDDTLRPLARDPAVRARLEGSVARGPAGAREAAARALAAQR